MQEIKSNKIIDRIEPPSWWTGMNTSLQLMMHGKDLKGCSIECQDKGVEVTNIHYGDSPNYIFADIVIHPDTEPGEYSFLLKKGDISEEFTYRLGKKRERPEERKSFDSSDMIYLIMPDRFSKGDNVGTDTGRLKEKENREDAMGRHGGNLRGIINHLDYLADLGATTLWLTPFQIDDEETGSYHGYACADYYNTDPRYGTNEIYKELVEKSQEKGMKVIMDVVINHCGLAHWWMNDLPFRNWVHMRHKDIRSTYRLVTLTDPNVSPGDLSTTINGWFDGIMPDMALENEFVLRYFVQLYIWWIEWADLDGLRVDTFPYNERHAAAEWTKQILEEYPWLSIVAECWHSSPAVVSYWDGGKTNPDGYCSNLTSVMDFPLQEAIDAGLSDARDAWDAGMNLIYEALAHDFLYSDPRKLLIFLDNHDTGRFADIVVGNPGKVKMGLTMIATMRGIAQLTYGTEYGFRSVDLSKGDGGNRADFPGGWEDDDKNLFSGENADPIEKNIYEHARKLFNWRKGCKAIHEGKTMHFLPEAQVYSYVRYTDNEAVLVFLNGSEKRAKVDWEKYSGIIQTYRKGTDILTGNEYTVGESLNVPSRTSLVLELEK